MLRSLSLDNFRAFERAELQFSKLNILVGPNNSGKSSIISAINLIAQNVRRGTQEFSLALNGPYAELGTFYDVVTGHSARSTVGLSFAINQFHYNYRFRYRPQRREIELIAVKVADSELEYAYENIAKTIKQTVTNRKTEEVTDLSGARARFFGLFVMPPSFAYRVGVDGLVLDDKFRRIRDFNIKSMSLLERHFQSFDSVGAFRAAPERTYHYTGEAPTTIGRYGENFAQMLASGARQGGAASVARRVTNWFSASGVAKSLKINSLTNRHFEILVEDLTGAENNIIDSGFGCSQVLPVLVGGYMLLRDRNATRPPMFVVQEPEIHLHPTAAAELGTYFCDLAAKGVQCFVETHSENIVLRVASHVAKGNLRPSDVAIYWVSATTGEHRITPLPLNEDGTFGAEWPDGFFPTRADETLRLARAASGISEDDAAERTLSDE